MAGVASVRDRLRESLWFVPSLCMGAAAAANFILVQLDRQSERQAGLLGFTGGPESARSILSTIGSSVLVLTGLVFSITILALQLTSSQFSPRAIRAFLRDRQTQVALGILLSTFLFALLALREVRGQDGTGAAFVPGLTVAVAFILAVASLFTFIHQVHHLAQSIRVVNVIGKIARETDTILDHHLPKEDPAPSTDLPVPAAGGTVVPASSSGVVTFVDTGKLVERAAHDGIVVEVLPRPGEFVPRGGPLLRILGGDDHDGGDLDRLRRAVILGPERTMRQDPGYGLRQLVDIAERALSPGINDPSTAVQCLDRIHALLRRIGTSPLPDGRFCDGDGHLRVVLHEPGWSDYLHLGIDEMRHWGSGSPQVRQRLGALLLDLHGAVPAARRPPVAEQQRLLTIVSGNAGRTPNREDPAGRHA